MFDCRLKPTDRADQQSAGPFTPLIDQTTTTPDNQQISAAERVRCPTGVVVKSEPQGKRSAARSSSGAASAAASTVKEEGGAFTYVWTGIRRGI